MTCCLNIYGLMRHNNGGREASGSRVMADARKEGVHSLHSEMCHKTLGCGAVAVADVYQSFAVCCSCQ